MRRQLRLSVACAATFLLALLGMPLLNYFAADLMSNTIAAIRSDTENVVSEISQLEAGFGDVEGKISALQANAGKFAANLVR